MQIRNELTAHLNFLLRNEQRLEKIIKKKPPGKLIKKHAKSKDYFYVKSEDNKVESLLNNTKAIDVYRYYDSVNKKLKTIKHDIPLLKTFICQYKPMSYDDSFFINASSNQNQYKIENARHQYNDIFFRSKSEMNFAQLLTSYNIPFRYEAALRLSDGKTIYPDFIIKRPSDGKIFIVEYFGMMSNEDYRNSAYEKINHYHRNGYIMWDNFIAIFEYNEVPVNLDSIDRIIKNFLL